jgi:glutamate dehydrogenase/leucine dehydrogenase
VQNRMGYFWEEKDVLDRMERILVDSFKDVVDSSERHETSARIGAYCLAVERVAYSHEMRGMYA